jgi:hypothetical protein
LASAPKTIRALDIITIQLWIGPGITPMSLNAKAKMPDTKNPSMLIAIGTNIE